VPADDVRRPPLDVPTLTAALSGTRWRAEVLAESPSTNAHVAALARAGEPTGLVLVAEHQSAGRGRLDRVWVTPPRAALTVSLLVEPAQVPVGRWPWLPLLTGLAVVDAVEALAGRRAWLKWPNDVLLGDRKLAGILTERIERGGGAVAVVGVGMNVTTTRDELPVDTATSLTLAGVPGPDRTALLLALLGSFDRWYDAWVRDRGAGLRDAYTAACSTVGRTVRVEVPGGGVLRGAAVGVDEEGRLLVDDGSGARPVGAGDVVHVRPG